MEFLNDKDYIDYLEKIIEDYKEEIEHYERIVDDLNQVIEFNEFDY